MKRGRKPKFVTIRIYLDNEEVYINGNRINELKETKLLDILKEDIYKALKSNK